MIPIKPLGRVLTQFVFVVSGSIIKATYNAYKQTVNNSNGMLNTKLSKIMSKEEAAKILGFDSYNNLKLNQIREAHLRLKKINTPSGTFQGSPYLVEKIDSAHHILTNYYKSFINNNHNL